MDFSISFLVFCLTAYWLTAFVNCRIMRKSFRWKRACQLVCFNDIFRLKHAFIKEKMPSYFVITAIWFCPASIAFLLSHSKFRWKNTVVHVDMDSLQWSCFVTYLSDFQIPMMYCMVLKSIILLNCELWIGLKSS